MNKKKIITLALVAVLAVTAVAGVSVAYFTDTKTSRNVFTMGNVKISLDEAPVDGEGHATDGARVTENEYGTGAAYPGAVLDKDPTVHNIGKNPAYIRAVVNVSDWKNLCADFFPDFTEAFPEDGYKASLNLLVGETGEGWSVIEVKEGDTFNDDVADVKFVLKYDGILAAGEDTTPIFTKVTIPASFGENGMSAESFDEIKITAQAIQTNSFDSWEEAFSAFDGG